MEVAGHPRHDIARADIPMPLRLAHEAIDSGVSGHPEMRVRLQEMIDSNELPAIYYDNPTVLAHPTEVVLPLDIFVDGLPYSLVDSVVAIWLINVVTKRRHVLAVVCKRLSCKCGCHGWCTFSQCGSLFVGAWSVWRKESSRLFDTMTMRFAWPKSCELLPLTLLCAPELVSFA